jgi:hypothetical protein
MAVEGDGANEDERKAAFQDEIDALIAREREVLDDLHE